MSRKVQPRGYRASPEEVADLRRRIIAGAAPGGTIQPHLKELESLGPDVAGIDLLSFVTDITATGVITQPDKQSLPGGFFAELTSVRGFMQKPATEPELMAVCSFNVKDLERTGSIFSNDIPMGFICKAAEGAGEEIYFERGLYVFDPGSRVQVKFTVDGDATLGYANLASAAKKWGVLLKFNLYAMQ